MGLFSGLSDRLNHIFSKMKSRGKLTEMEIKQAMREIRIALLEADVNLLVVKEFIAKVTEKAIGEEIIQSLTPGQQVVKIVNDELTALMGSTASKLEVSPKPPTVYMMCGLQGAGKTTMCGKLALMLKKQGKNPLLVACDIYRPAAINQLKVVGGSVSVPVFEQGTQNPRKTATMAIKEAERNGYDTVIIDTAGRLHIDKELMEELIDVKKAVSPDEILLVVDSMTGQDAVTVAKSFDEKLDITGVVLTKLDGDTRGGAALSIKAVTGKPIKLCGVGEKMTDLEQFFPDRMASRILGMGDVLTLIDKAQSAVTQQEMEKMEARLRENRFTLDDFLSQMDALGRMGNLGDLIGMIPGASRLKGAEVDESKMRRFKAIIQSMTMYEREHPEIIKASRRKRIAEGSGTSIPDVNQLLNSFNQSKEMLKQLKGKKGKRFPF